MLEEVPAAAERTLDSLRVSGKGVSVILSFASALPRMSFRR